MAARRRRRLHPGVHVRRAVRRRRGGARLLRTVARRVPATTRSTSRSTAASADEKRPLIHHAAVLPGLVLACTRRRRSPRSVRSSPTTPARSAWPRPVDCSRVYALVLVARPGVRRPHARAARPASGGHHRHQQHHDLAADPLARARRCRALWIAAVFMGLGVAFNYPSLMALTVNRASDRDRAMAVSSFTMFFEVGSAVGGLLLGAWAQIVGKQYGFLGGVVFCVARPLAAARRRSSRRRRPMAGRPSRTPSPASTTSPSPATDDPTLVERAAPSTADGRVRFPLNSAVDRRA